MDINAINTNAQIVADEWKEQVSERQQRTELQEDDYNQLKSINIPL